MEKDKRSLNQETQYELRRQVVKLKLEKRTGREIAAITGLSVQSINKTWKAYKDGGVEAIKIHKRGRRVGTNRKLAGAQEKKLMKLIIDKTPDQLKFKFMLWTRPAIREVAKKLFDVDLPLTTISRYLHRWGFTPQKATVRAYEQDPKAIKKWLDDEFPAIRARAVKEKAEIHWGDETGVEADSYADKGFAPAGHTPVLRLSTKMRHVRVNMISSITNQGKVRFMFYGQNGLTSALFIKFMKRLITDAPRKIFLIVDNIRVHHSKVVSEWLSKKEHSKKIEIFYLPSNSPQLNPDERLNADLKHQVRSGEACHDGAQMAKKALSTMRMLQKRPKRIKSYFGDKNIQYAA